MGGLWRAPTTYIMECGVLRIDKGPGYTFNTLVELGLQGALDKWSAQRTEDIFTEKQQATYKAANQRFDQCFSDERRELNRTYGNHVGPCLSHMVNASSFFKAHYRDHLNDEKRQVETTDEREKWIWGLCPAVDHEWRRQVVHESIQQAIRNCEQALRAGPGDDSIFDQGERDWCTEYKKALEQMDKKLDIKNWYAPGNLTHMADWSALIGQWLAKWAVHKGTKELGSRVVLGRTFQLKSVLMNCAGRDYTVYTLVDEAIRRKNPAGCALPSVPLEVPFAAYPTETGQEAQMTIYGTHPTFALLFDRLTAKAWDYAQQAPLASVKLYGMPYYNTYVRSSFAQCTLVDRHGNSCTEVPTPSGLDGAPYNYVAHHFDYFTMWRMSPDFNTAANGAKVAAGA